MQFLIKFLLVLHVVVCVLMVLVVLMQRPRSEGLGAAFGGGMTENLFGAQTTTVLTRFTVWLGGAFFGLTLLLAVLYAKNTTRQSALDQKLRNAPPAPAASPAPDAAKEVPAASPAVSPETATPAPAASAPAATPAASPAASPAVESPAPSPAATAVPVPAS
jgi:preprotein translocase subunit SecG